MQCTNTVISEEKVVNLLQQCAHSPILFVTRPFSNDSSLISFNWAAAWSHSSVVNEVLRVQGVLSSDTGAMGILPPVSLEIPKVFTLHVTHMHHNFLHTGWNDNQYRDEC